MIDVSKLSPQVARNLSTALDIVNGDQPYVFDDKACRGSSERCIEVPWVAQWLSRGKRVLDVGFTMSSLDWLGVMLVATEELGIKVDAVDIVRPEKVLSRYPEAWQEMILKIPLTVGDVRDSVLPKDSYDLITCISTIEHIGFDYAEESDPNTAFKRGTTPEDVKLDREDDVNERVLKKFHDSLKVGGRVLMTVPMGKGGATLLRDSLGLYTRQWEYDAASWNELISHEGFRLIEERFFCYQYDVWSEVAGPNALIEQSSSLQPHAMGCAVVALEKE